MSDETIENERNLSAEETVEMEKTESAAAVSAEAPKKAKKKGKFGTAFSDLIHNFGKGGWVLFVTMILTFLVMVGTCILFCVYNKLFDTHSRFIGTFTNSRMVFIVFQRIIESCEMFAHFFFRLSEQEHHEFIAAYTVYVFFTELYL